VRVGSRALVGLVCTTLAASAVCGCGSTSSENPKQARIAADLRKLEHKLLEKHEAKGPSALPADSGAFRVIFVPAPKGVSQREWIAAVEHDKRLEEISGAIVTSGGPTAIEVPTPAAVTQAGGHELAEYERGKKVVAQSGCLACHKIGENGNAGPGPNLTQVADRLPRQAIERTLIHPTAPMPSFSRLPPEKFQAIVSFLTQLK
jgi:mono/diheme cytochrome c family protein